MRTFHGVAIRKAVYGVLILLASHVAMAHHSYVMFDMSTQKKIAGTVHALEWTNPHVWLWVAVLDDRGNRTLYAFEGLSPGEMNRRNGWTKGSVLRGQAVTVEYHPFKDGRHGGRLGTVTLPGDRTLHVSSGILSVPPAAP
jgi:uncharacterized protein DUF6152